MGAPLGRWSAFAVCVIGVAYSGALCVAGVLGPASGNMRLQWVGVFGYGGVLPVVCLMLG